MKAGINQTILQLENRKENILAELYVNNQNGTGLVKFGLFQSTWFQFGTILSNLIKFGSIGYNVVQFGQMQSSLV